MKKHLSVWMLLARATLLPFAGICAVCVGVQYALFSFGLQTQGFLADKGLENAFDHSFMPLTAAVGFVLVLFVLSCGCGAAALRTDNTIRRLCISHNAFCGWHAVHTAACLLVFWAVQLAAALAFAARYLERFDPLGTQTVFLAFWRQSWLHSLLPVLDPLRWVRNLLLAAALALASADLARRLRGGERGYWLPVLAAAVLSMFKGSPDGLLQDIVLLLFSVTAIGCILARWLGEGTDDEED